MLTRKQSALVHVARRHLALADEDYREVLRQEAGVTSSKDLDAAGLAAVMARMERLGFSPRPSGRHYGERYGMATPAQVAYIRSLWAEYTGSDGDDRR